MIWFGTDWFGTDWYGTDWYSSTEDTVGQWFGDNWFGADWYGTNWYPTGEILPYAFVAAGTAGALDLTTYASVFQTRFVRQGTLATLGLTTGYAGFVPDTGGILDNDSDPDGDPLSYQIVAVPEAGVFNAYAGGAFSWDPTGLPAGRYRFTYELFAGGESGGVGTVWLEHGELFPRLTVTGYAGQFTGFVEQGTRGTLTVTGFSGEVQTPWIEQGTAGDLDLASYAAAQFDFGFVARGTAGTLNLTGYAGLLTGTFVQAGDAGDLDVEGFAGTLTLTDFLNEAGTAATLTVTGYAGEFSRFDEAGTAGTLDAYGLAGLLQIGLNPIQGAAGTLKVEGFAGTLLSPKPSMRSRRHKPTLPPPQRQRVALPQRRRAL